MAEEAPTASALMVNGRVREVCAEPDTPLLHVLRNHLGLKCSRFGCGLGVCGACLVLVDGHPAYSCDTPIWSVDGKDVTTVEGLGADGEPRPVARSIVAVIGHDDDGLVSDMVSFGLEYAAVVRDDHRHFVEAFRGGRIPGVTAT